MPHAAHKLEPDPSEIAPGRGIGHFVIQERIGRGGMGHVYKVRDKVLGRTLALKLLSPIHAMDSEQRERFDREIVTLARLNHPNVVPVYEAGAHEGCPFYVMELIEGEDLDRRVMRNGAFDEREAARIILQVAQGVSHMHERDVIHRDIKPANILLRKDGSAALTDFGLARGMKPERNLTQTGMAIGTPAYMSPEQAKGDVALIGPATDIYQLGATLYTLVTGLEPYKDVPAHKQMMAVVEGAGPAFGVGAVSAPLRAIIRKAMARNIRKRYLTVKAFADDIERFLAHEWVLARGRNPVGRALYWLRRYAAAVIVAAVGIVIITSVILVGLNDPGYGQEPRYGGKKTFRADAPAPELELLVHGATSTITTVGHTVTRDAAESQIEILAKPGTTAFGWGDYQAVVEVRDIEPAKAVVHCFVGGAPDTPQSGLRVTVGRGRFAVTDKGYELVNLPVDDGEGALRLTLNRRAESIELTLVRGNVTAGQAVLRDHFRPAANECAQGFGIVSEASRLTLGEVS
ncbi:MAG: serine/threonine protein kinase, partial [Planctomycetes bacterium]|nr:serine/threonine protein kinase [Planctomycetota bacterium]